MVELSSDDLTGHSVGGYSLMRRIGIGGMGVVYEGLHPIIGKRVAVKFLLKSFSNDTELLDRFKQEAQSVNAIGHRGIVDIFAFDKMDDGTQYFVMEFLEGRPFDQIIAADAPLPAALVTRYLEEILDALAAAHAANVIHRDIKPSNVFLIENGRTRPYVKLLDFGIAKVNSPKTGTTPQTRQSVVIGTPEYIAPEQAQGKTVGPTADLYAVGCMAFEMLTGQLPFRGENPLDTMFKHVVDPTPRVSSLAPGVPPQLDELIFRLMQKKPEDRPQSAQVVLQQLEAARGVITGDLAPIPPPPRQPVGLEHEMGEGIEPTRKSQPVRLEGAGRSRAPWLVAFVIAALVGVWGTALVLRRSGDRPEALPMARPLPTPVAVAAPLDAGEPLVADVVPVEPLPVAVLPVELPAEVDAGPAVAVKPIRRGISSMQIASRISIIDRKIEMREARRGEKAPLLRNFLQQAREQASDAKTDADRKAVWDFLDDLARQIER